ncbi:DNA-3-methyladenine glycosylase I [Bacteroidota bacterium]
MKTKKRCEWCLSSDLMIEYHDKEWGVPLHDDKKLFEYMLLDAFQAGLSWSTIINKRKNFVKAFDGFDVAKISRYRDGKIKKLLNDAGIVRNRLKIHSAVSNAKAFLSIQKEFGSFDKYIWQFVKGEPIINKCKSLKDIPVSTKESDAMSKDLKARGFRFVGTTICYAFMQAAGMVNDHLTDCYRYKELKSQM